LRWFCGRLSLLRAMVFGVICKVDYLVIRSFFGAASTHELHGLSLFMRTLYVGRFVFDVEVVMCLLTCW